MSAGAEDEVKPKDDEGEARAERAASRRARARDVRTDVLRRTIRGADAPDDDPDTAALARELEEARRRLDAYLRALERREDPPEDGEKERS